jgi:hypothetical protein
VRGPFNALLDAIAFHVTESPSLKFIRFSRQVLIRYAAGCSKLSQVNIYCQAKRLLESD